MKRVRMDLEFFGQGGVVEEKWGESFFLMWRKVSKRNREGWDGFWVGRGFEDLPSPSPPPTGKLPSDGLVGYRETNRIYIYIYICIYIYIYTILSHQPSGRQVV
jgi:hypothetical protein